MRKIRSVKLREKFDARDKRARISEKKANGGKSASLFVERNVDFTVAC